MKKWYRMLAILVCLACLLPAAALAEVVKLPIDTSGGMPFSAEFNRDVMVYDDPSIHVDVTRVLNQEAAQQGFECAYYYTHITLADASQLRTASANGFENRNRTKAHVMARRVNAVLAINGDFYGARAESYVLRQGVVYRDSVGPNQDVLLIDEDGDFHVILAKDDPASADKTTWDGKKIINAFTFGPALIVDNQVVLDESSSPSMSAPESRSQRMCIIQTGPLQYMTLCCREVGCTAQEMVDLVRLVADNVEVAYLLDGGESSQLVFIGTLLNKKERVAREVTDIIYFASAYVPDEGGAQ